MPKVDKKEVGKLKKAAGSEKFTTTSFMAHSKKVEAATWKRDSGRLCYWCIKTPCLKKRATHWENQSGGTKQEGEPYLDYRKKLDDATNHMCTEYKSIKARSETGAEIFQANAFQAENAESDNETDSGREGGHNLHCHESCAKYYSLRSKSSSSKHLRQASHDLS